MHQFSLEGSPFIELNNLLKVVGVCDSGGRANTIITCGDVKVDGQVELRKRCKIREGQLVKLGDVVIEVVE